MIHEIEVVPLGECVVGWLVDGALHFLYARPVNFRVSQHIEIANIIRVAVAPVLKSHYRRLGTVPVAAVVKDIIPADGEVCAI